MSSNILRDLGGRMPRGPKFADILATLSGGTRIHALNVAAKKLRKQRTETGLSVLDIGIVSHPLPPADVLKVAEALIECIEAAESKSIEALDEQRTQYYVSTLAEAARQNCSSDKGEELLADLRSPIVYLAETTSDLKAERGRVEEELRANGCRVVSESLLPDDGDEYETRIQKAMERATLSIHLVGPQFDASVEMQYNAARGRNLSQVVWISKDAQAAQERQAHFLIDVRNESRGNLELLEGKTIGQMEEIVFELLGPLPSAAPTEIKRNELIRIYVICAREDHPALVQEPNQILLLRDYFMAQPSFEVKLPLSSPASPVEMRQDNREKLKQCDGVLIYWGHASEAWVEEKLRELTQAVGWRDSRTFSSKAIYLADPPSPMKQRFVTREATVIPHAEAFSQDAWQSFLAPLQNR